MTGTTTTASNYWTTDSWTYYPTVIPSGSVVINSPQVIQGGTSVDFESPTGLKGQISVQKDVKGIHPKLYFSYVKSKFTKLEKEKLNRRINKLRSMVISADEMNQQGLYEQLALMLAIAVRESEAEVCGFNKWIHKDSINKFIPSVKGKTVIFGKLENFPRLIPSNIQGKIKYCKDRDLFDDYWILYTDYTGEKLKTNKEKIREKDPIIFGTFSFQEKILYVIGDWVDEYCDITVDKVVEKLRVDDPEYNLGGIPKLSDKDLKKLIEEVKIRHNRLAGTSPSNYKDNMMKEDRDRLNREGAFSFWKNMIKKFRGN